MWGALIFLLFFLVIDPTTREAILAAVEEARIRLAVEAPLPYFMLVIVLGSASVSALIMRLWPRVENRPKRVQILRRYQGRAEADLVRMPQARGFGLPQVLASACFVLPVRAKLACGRLLRHLSGFAGLKRVPGA